MILGAINCNSCKICCEGDTINLIEGDNPNLYKTKLVNGQRVLAKNKKGNCIYLTKNGCGIYFNRPKMCVAFDCRKYFLKLQEMGTEALKERMNNPKLASVIHEGKKRLEVNYVSSL